MAKARILEITLSVMGAGEDGYPDPDLLEIANPVAAIANTDADLAGRTSTDATSGDRLVISVRVAAARRYARHRAKLGMLGW